MAFMLHFRAANSVASQSSRGWSVGGAPWEPKSFLGFDEAEAEILLPNAVHHHAGGEGVGGIEEPAGEVEAVGMGGGGGERREDAGSAGVTFSPGG